MGFHIHILKATRETFSSETKHKDGTKKTKLSSKRIITFMAFLLVAIAFVASVFFAHEVDENIYNGMIQIVFAGLGVTVGEHLLKSRNEYGENINELDGAPDSNPDSNMDSIAPPHGDNQLGDN